jgi:thioredoxin-like negative regulator of GroEL
LEQLALKYAGRVKFTILDIERDQIVASKERVTGTPTLFFYNRGRLVDKVVGALPEEELRRHVDKIAA